jgi:hypothetical protein
VSGESWSEGRVRGNWGFLALAAAGAVALLVAGRMDPVRAWANLLVHGYYLVALALGCLVLLAIFYLAEAGWFVAFRRVPEAMAAQLPLLSLLLLLVLFGRDYLYHWTDAAAVAADPLLQTKAPYLNEGSFILRMGVFLVLWSLFAVAVRRVSQGNGTHADGLAKRRRLKLLSAVFIPLYAVTFSLASFDWLMSLEPHWFSTIFAVYQFAGMFVGSVAAITVAVVLLARPGRPLAGLIRGEHLHDLGKMLFAFSTFWAYIWLSQYLLIWYSNLPEEVTHYVVRTQGGWLPVFAVNLILNWIVPFTVLMGRTTKRDPRVLGAVAVVVLVGRWWDLELQVQPALGVAPPGIGLVEVLCLAGAAGLFIYLTRRGLGAGSLVPEGDPLLTESQSYHA